MREDNIWAETEREANKRDRKKRSCVEKARSTKRRIYLGFIVRQTDTSKRGEKAMLSPAPLTD